MTQQNEAALGVRMISAAVREGHKPFHLTRSMSSECIGGVKPIKNDWIKILNLLNGSVSPLSSNAIKGFIGLPLEETRNRITSLLRARLVYNANDGFPAMYLLTNSGLDRLEDLKADRL